MSRQIPLAFGLDIPHPYDDVKSLGESLYDALLVPRPEGTKASPATGGPWPIDGVTGQEFAETVVNSEEFRAYILYGLRSGDLPAAVVCRFMDHAWGVPVKRMEIEDTTPIPVDRPALLARLQYLQTLLLDASDELVQEHTTNGSDTKVH